jgi:hypothetical protein
MVFLLFFGALEVHGIDHMVVGDHQSRGADEEAGTRADPGVIFLPSRGCGEYQDGGALHLFFGLAFHLLSAGGE